MAVDPNITPEQSDLKEGTDYKITKWRGHDNYECARCDYATLYFFKMEEHFDLEAVHNHVWSADAKEPQKDEPPAEAVRRLEY